jgi:hypothetical protein
MRSTLMTAVMIGIDPRKGSHTAVAITAAEQPQAELQVRASAAQAGQLFDWAQAWPERTWAVRARAGWAGCWPSSWSLPASGSWMRSRSWHPGAAAGGR